MHRRTGDGLKSTVRKDVRVRIPAPAPTEAVPIETERPGKLGETYAVLGAVIG